MHDTQYHIYMPPTEWTIAEGETQRGLGCPVLTKDVGERFIIRQQGKSSAKKVLVKLFLAKDNG